MSKWISFADARELYLDRREQLGLGTSAILNAENFYHVMIAELAESRLDSRTARPETFRLTYRFEAKTKSYGVSVDNIIPSIFWHHWREVLEDVSLQPLLDRSTETYFKSYHNTYEFRQLILPSEAILEGFASEVEFRRDQIPDLPPPAGRPKGMQKELESDLAVVNSAAADIKAGRMTFTEAVATYWDKLDARGISDASVKTRLRRRLKSMGISDK